MTQVSKPLTLNNKQLARAAVGITAAVLGFACSSSSSGQPFNGDAATTGGDAGTPEDVTAPPMPCDAAIVLPTDGAIGAACGECLLAHCAADLSTCQMTDCTCVSSIECLAANR